MQLSPAVEVPLPTDKLRWCAVQQGSNAHRAPHRPVVLVACGSFNPPTYAHLRMFDLAQHALAKAGYDVLGGYLSPVNDRYGKPGLLPASRRLRMCELAADAAPDVMVDRWEAAQPDYQRSLWVLQRVQSQLRSIMEGGCSQPHGSGKPGCSNSANGPSLASDGAPSAGERGGSGGSTQPQPGPGGSSAPADVDPGPGAQGPHPGAPAPGEPVRAMLLCGADVVASFGAPGVWREEQLRAILCEHGVVCVARQGTDVQALLSVEGTLLHELRERILVVSEPVASALSSTAIRTQVGRGRPVRYLTPDAVVEYIRKHGLYASGVS